jgi:hypothetical protein
VLNPQESGGTPLTEWSDYELAPYPAKHGVFTGIDFLTPIPLPVLTKRTTRCVVDVTGNWGFAEVPEDVKHWCNVTVAELAAQGRLRVQQRLQPRRRFLERPAALPAAASRAQVTTAGSSLMARGTVKAGGIGMRLGVEMGELEQTSQIFKDARNQIARELRDVMAEAATDVVVPVAAVARPAAHHPRARRREPRRAQGHRQHDLPHDVASAARPAASSASSSSAAPSAADPPARPRAAAAAATPPR